MMIIKINRRLHRYLAALIYQARLSWAKRQARRWARRTGERALVLHLERGGKVRPRAVRWSKIPTNMRHDCLAKAIYVAYPPATTKR